MSGKPLRLITGVSLFLALALAGVSMWAAPPAKKKLSAHAEQLLQQARAEGKSTVVLLVATKPGQTKSVEASLKSLGATTRFSDDTSGYLRVIIPTKNVEAAANLGSVQAVELYEIIPLYNPRPEAEAEVDVAPPDVSTPNQNAYMPTRDIGAPQFVASNPIWDGRGVRVGIVDTGITLDHPALSTTTTGARKIVDWVTFTDPVIDDDPTWINMKDQVSGATFTYRGLSYTAPYGGTFRIGVFDERDPRLGGELGSDVNRDGNPQGSSGIFAVLWDASTNNVFVDVNQNRSFADEMAMTDYRVRYDVNYFGVDNPATAVAERMPFVVQTNGKDKWVNIGIASGAHASHVAGIVAAKGMFGGSMNGAAPGAQLVSVRACLFIAGCTNAAMVEGMIYATKQASVDLINMSIGGLPAINDGNNVRAILYNRLIEQTKAQFFFSAGNSGPGMNTVSDPGVATDVVALGAYVSKESWLANYGADAAKEDGIFPFSSRGPAENGGFKPNLIAPGSAVSTVPMWQAGQPVAGTYALPPGYGMFNGTSMASPQAAGGAALLVSAAKQSGVQFKPIQLRQALFSSARYLPAYGAYEQGAGLVQVPAAWDILRTNTKADQVISSAPVSTVISSFLETPNSGVGIYEREGWPKGEQRVRQITFRRATGGSGAIPYNLSWIGNDGTFSSAQSISLPLNTLVSLPVTINPQTAGIHSALLALDDPSSPGIEYHVLNTVIATDNFGPGVFSISYPGSADRPDSTRYFFNVPATSAFKVDVTDTNGRVRLLRYHPYGLPLDNLNTTGYQTGGTQSRTVSLPLAGVWEVTVDTSRTSAVSPATFNVVGSILNATVSPNPHIISSATINVPVAASFTATNTGGAFTGRMVGTTLGSAQRVTKTISTGQTQTYTVDIPTGATSLTAAITATTNLNDDLDLYIYNCTSGTCVLAAQSATAAATESATVNNPAAGLWAVAVVGFATPSGSTSYNYTDRFLAPGFGSITVTDADALRATGSSWTAPATITAQAAPAKDRVLNGFVQVRSGTVVIGSAEVVIESVVP